MKKLGCLLGLAGLGWLLYGLFQPVVEWNFGWSNIPSKTFEQRFIGIEDPTYAEAIASSKNLIDSIHKVSKSSSISVAAMIHGKMVWSYAVGLQDIANSVPADTLTSYRIGSVSKALTSLGLGKLIQKDQIHPDSSIQYYTGHFSEKPGISIRQLASHQSGIRNYGVCFCFPIWEYYSNKEYKNVEASLSQFESDDLLYAPGKSFAYSSYNFTALSLAMEKASNLSFIDFMEDQVFKPLGMNGTKPDIQSNQPSNQAVPYDAEQNSYKPSIEVNLSSKWAGGGFVSTPSDLARAGNALLDSSFLDKRTIEMLTTPQRLNDGTVNKQNYALGWRHDFSERYFNGIRKVEVIHHGGMAMGGMALLVVYPEYDLVFAITTNKSGQEGRFELFDYIKPIAELFIEQLRK